jgi:3-mercaptopyruvate sulfurtransferase SseA
MTPHNRSTALALAVVLCAWPLLDLVAHAQSDDPATVPRISQADFKKAWLAKTILVIDVRDEAGFAAGHIPGAVLVPLAELAKHVQQLKAERRPIVAYCA